MDTPGDMNKQYKIIISVCALAILCNFVAKYYLVNEQNRKIIILQQVIAAARSGSYIQPEIPLRTVSTDQDDINSIVNKIPEEFLFTQYAVKLRKLMDTNELSVEKNLIFKPFFKTGSKSGKTGKSDLLQYNTNIAVTGDYIQIKKFITDILNLPGLAYFSSVNFARSKDNQDRVELKCKLSVFFKKGTV